MQGSPVSLVPYTNRGNFQVTVGNAAKDFAGLGVTIPSGASAVYIQTETVDIRFRRDGAAPTASIGSRIYVGTYFPLEGDLPKIQLISTGVDSVTNIEFLG